MRKKDASISNIIGCNIKNIRILCGITVRDASKLVAVSVQTWYKWERGEVIPDDANKGKIASLFGVTISKIMKGVPGEGGGDYEGRDKIVPSPKDPASEQEYSSQIDAIFQLQKTLSTVQFILSAAGHHMAGGQSLKYYDDLAGLITSLRELTTLNEDVISHLEGYLYNGTSVSNQSLREARGDIPSKGDQVGTA